MRIHNICVIDKLASKLVFLNTHSLQASKNKDIHGDDGAKQIGKPNFNLQPPDAHVDGHDDDDHEGAADGMEKHDNRIENQGPVNLQVRKSSTSQSLGKEIRKNFRDQSVYKYVYNFRPKISENSGNSWFA